MSEPTPNTPKTFDELLEKTDGQSNPKQCSRCGKYASHRVAIRVTRPTAFNVRETERGGNRTRTIALHGNHLCEPCAVAVFARFREIVR